MKKIPNIKYRTLFSIVSFLSFLALFFPHIVLAAAAAAPAATTKVTLTSLENVLQDLIIAAAGFMFGFAIFEYIGAGGDSKKIGNAKGYLMSAVTALIALVLVKMFLK